jgi:hypothetical protein
MVPTVKITKWWFQLKMSNTTGVIGRTGTTYPTWVHPDLNLVRLAQSVVFSVVFCGVLFVIFPFIFLPLHYLFFFNLRLSNINLVSSYANYFKQSLTVVWSFKLGILINTETFCHFFLYLLLSIFQMK